MSGIIKAYDHHSSSTIVGHRSGPAAFGKLGRRDFCAAAASRADCQRVPAGRPGGEPLVKPVCHLTQVSVALASGH